MTKYYLAIDIGASSGRHILGYLENGRIILEEVYRFSNGMENIDGSLCWNVSALFENIIAGLKKCKEIGKIPEYMGVDTWGVDFVLLDKDDKMIGKAVGYRDRRTAGMDAELSKIISPEDLYKRTGIQKQIFNTIYQLLAIKKYNPEDLDRAERLLMIPDYFHFLLSGNKVNEYTNATTGQLVDPNTKNWDFELIKMLGLPEKIFSGLQLPTTIVGEFSKTVSDLVGFSCKVILPPTHDTASSVLAIPANDDDGIYICSGTWSLMGIEQMHADCSLESMRANFTNEGGYNYRFRFLKNIMGLWMIQSVKKELNDEFSFAELCSQAEKESIESIVDCNDGRFLAPESMINEIKNFCLETNQRVPEKSGEISAVVYNSLAKCYADTFQEIEKITGKKFSKIHIVGGGANAEYLNILTAKYLQKPVFAGPTESTALGNIISQMLYEKEFKSLEAARKCIFESFEIKEYKDKR